MNPEEQQLVNKTPEERRNFLKGMGFTGLGLAAAGMVGSRLGVMDSVTGKKAIATSNSVHAASITDADILNFALNLEYVEAEFYVKAITGRTIEYFGVKTTGTGTHGKVMGGKRVNLAPGGEVTRKLLEIALEIAYDETEHVVFLRDALGAAAVARPDINLDALGYGFENYRQFLTLARAFEDTGVSAYGGAAPLITSKDYLSAAVRIGLTEAYHASNLRLLIAQNNIPVPADDSLDVLPPPAGRQYFTVDQQALAIVRTTSQVLSIVYGNSTPGTTSGGFFPSGVNGVINTV